MRKKLYLISFYFAPLGRADGVNRAYLSRYLADIGWDVDVICADNPRGLLRNYQQDPSLLDILGPKVTRHPVAYDFRYGLPELWALAHLTPDPFTHWMQPALARARQVIDAPGVVYAVVPPLTNATIAWRIAQEKKLPLVLDFRDNFFGLTQNMVQSASGIVASTEYSLGQMQDHYNTSRHGVNSAVYMNGFPDIEKDADSANASAHQDLRIIYTGLLNWEQHPWLAVTGAKRLARKTPDLASRIHFDFYGPRNYYTRLIGRDRDRELARFHGYRPFVEARRHMRQSSLGLSTLFAKSKRYCVPSKVFQYLAAGLPIFAATPGGALEEFVSDSGMGVHTTTNPDDIARALRELLEDPARITTMRTQVIARRAQYSMRAQTAILSAFLDQVAV